MKIFIILLISTSLSFAQRIEQVDSILNAVDRTDPTYLEEVAEASRIAKLRGYDKGIADCWHLMGYYYYLQKNYSKSIYKFLLAEGIRKRTGESEKLAELYIHMSYVYEKASLFDEAIVTANEAMRLTASKLIESDARLVLGRAYVSKGLLDFGVVNLNMAIDIKKNIDREEVAVAYNQIGSIYQKQEQYTHAIVAHSRIERYTSNKVYLAKMHNNIAVCYHELFKFDKAELHYKKTLELNTTASGALNYAELSYQTGDKKRAFALLKLGNSLNPDLGHLSETYAKLGMYEKALEYSRKANEKATYDCELKSDETIKVAKQVEDYRIKENLLMAKENIKLAKEKDQIQNVVFITIAVLFAAGLAIGIYNYSYKAPKKHNVFAKSEK